MITIWEALEDQDNADLAYEDWREQLEDSVRAYNEEYGTSHDPIETVLIYIVRKGEHDD